MSERIRDNYYLTVDLLAGYDEKTFRKLMENEEFIDKAETALSAYIIRINRSSNGLCDPGYG